MYNIHFITKNKAAKNLSKLLKVLNNISNKTVTYSN